MNLKLKYFGMIAEKLDKSTELRELQVSTVSELIEMYESSLGELSFKVAVNQQLVDNNYSLKENDEVAFLPPFAGG